MQDIRRQIQDNASLTAPYLLMNALATIVAAYGLLADSTAVVIGAMVIAMLLGPITGIALGLVDGDNRLLRRALVAEIVEALTVVLIAFVIGALHRNIPAGKEILSRTAPNILDLIIALAGGAAGAYAVASPRISVGLIGVAIATALVPPLATFSILLARGESQLALGALLLFAANFVAIQVASSVVLWLLGYHGITATTRQSPAGLILRNAFSAMALAGLAVILSLSFTQSISKQLFESRIREVVADKLGAFSDAQLVEIESSQAGDILNLRVTVRTSRTPVYSEILDLQRAIATELQQVVALKLIDVPTIKLDPLSPPTRMPTVAPNATAVPTHTSTPAPTATTVPSATPTHASTPTPTPTATSTPTPTYTPTPIFASVANTGGIGIFLRDAPGGAIIAVLSEGAPLQILYRREKVDGVEWVDVRDALNRVGWAPTRFLSIRP